MTSFLLANQSFPALLVIGFQTSCAQNIMVSLSGLHKNSNIAGYHYSQSLVVMFTDVGVNHLHPLSLQEFLCMKFVINLMVTIVYAFYTQL
jgi:hypothetical protein